MNQNTTAQVFWKKNPDFFLITQLCLLHKVKSKTKPLFHPYQTHSCQYCAVIQSGDKRPRQHKHFPMRTRRQWTHTVPHKRPE